MVSNARSVVQKLDVIELVINKECIDCLVVSESWLNASHSSNLVKFASYLTFRDDRQDRVGGGAVVWARGHLKPVTYHLTGKPTCIEAVAVILHSANVQGLY